MSASRFVRVVWSCAALLFAACSPARLTVLAGPDSAAAVTSFAALVPNGLVTVRASADPSGELAHGSGARAALVQDLDCGDCFTIEPSAPNAFVVHGGSLLGVQYGLAQLLEVGGFRFYHPRQSLAPANVALPATAPEYGVRFTPAKQLRGIHLHTLHPIESYFDFMVPSAEHLDGAKHVIDWLVKNRGNFINWVALDNIAKDPAAAAAWHDHARAILDYAHARGVAVGIEVELFHGGNLQNAYDLLTDADLAAGDTHAVLEQRLGPLIGDLPFDKLMLSFGEFFGASPDAFIQQVNNTYDAVQAVRPGMELTALIHVGNAPNQHVQYMGMDILYYFLVQYANPAIIPWIHTVMYYDLFEDTGGAYFHDDFSLHRRYLLDRLQAHQPVAYYPETAYWVAFDDSVPTYLPIYMYTRALDLAQIDQQSAAAGGDPLGGQVIFSSGWEWGYWQNDYVSLRMTYRAPDRWQAPIDEMLAPYGAKGAALAAQIEKLATVQHDALIGQRLAPYMAGTDFLIESAYPKVISQPHRPSFADVAALSAADRATYESTVLAALDQLAADTQAVFAAIDAIGIAHDDRWYAEIRDGAAIDADRVRFIAALYRAAALHADGAAIDAQLATADAALADARRVVARRHAHLHDPTPARLLVEDSNATIYQYGYLNEADTLCYWVRERGLFDQQISGATATPPGCVLGF
ncbi:MAG TPA: hypothetical protein VF945_16820 [Polyangia bacterium]